MQAFIVSERSEPALIIVQLPAGLSLPAQEPSSLAPATSVEPVARPHHNETLLLVLAIPYCECAVIVAANYRETLISLPTA
jgi:hypothetical protein